MEGMEVCKMEKRFGIRYLRDVGVVYYDRLEKQTPDGRNIMAFALRCIARTGKKRNPAIFRSVRRTPTAFWSASGAAV